MTTTESVAQVQDPRLNKSLSTDNTTPIKAEEQKDSAQKQAMVSLNGMVQREPVICPEDISKYYRPELVSRLASSLGVVEVI